MEFKINEIFYSLQGEGYFTGTPAVFVRFSGCNLKCPFCDTQHTEGVKMTTDEIIKEINRYPARHIVLTGGEPSLFIDETFVASIKEKTGKFIAIETNGTHSLPQNIDWITLSPKFEFCNDANLAITECNELKVVFRNQDLSIYDNIKAAHRFLQPCDCGNPNINKSIQKKAVQYCLEHPEWRLSLQTHKLLGIQ
jgi:7-carboxy-7-deazaguanine synthase